jgi:hypothetical protein
MQLYSINYIKKMEFKTKIIIVRNSGNTTNYAKRPTMNIFKRLAAEKSPCLH